MQINQIKSRCHPFLPIPGQKHSTKYRDKPIDKPELGTALKGGDRKGKLGDDWRWGR